MVAPILPAGIFWIKKDRKFYDRRGRELDKQALNRERRRLKSGALGSYAQAAKDRRNALARNRNRQKKLGLDARQLQVENFFRAKFGIPQGGVTWSMLTQRYPEKFEGYIEEING